MVTKLTLTKKKDKLCQNTLHQKACLHKLDATNDSKASRDKKKSYLYQRPENFLPRTWKHNANKFIQMERERERSYLLQTNHSETNPNLIFFGIQVHNKQGNIKHPK